MSTPERQRTGLRRGVAPGMAANGAAGAATAAFVTLLVPPCVARPAAERRAHRASYPARLARITDASALLGLDARTDRRSPVFGANRGVSAAVPVTPRRCRGPPLAPCKDAWRGLRPAPGGVAAR